MSTADEPGTSAPAKIFISYAHRDKEYLDDIIAHLSNLRSQKLISDWHDRRIDPGDEWADEIDQALEDAHIILLLISARFMSSEYCTAREMHRALERHANKEAVVIPVILSACDWEGAPFSKLQALPASATPIKQWPDRDMAWKDVVLGIRRVLRPASPKAQAAGAPPMRVHHRCNRGPQAEAFEKALERHAERFPDRPMIALIHGEEAECPDLFLDRLQDEILPELLDLPLDKFFWGEPPGPGDSHQRFWKELGKQWLGRRFDAEAAARDAVLGEISLRGGHFLIRLQWYAEKFSSAQSEGLANFLRFWEGWPPLPENRKVICALSLVYSAAKDTRSKLLFWQKSPAERLREWVKEREGDEAAAGLLAVLPELRPVEHYEAKEWCDAHLASHHREEVKERVIEYFQGRQNQSVQMQTLVKELKSYLRPGPEPAQHSDRS